MTLKKANIIDTIFYIAIGVFFFFTAMTITMMEHIEIIAKVAKLMRYATYLVFVLLIIYHVLRLHKGITIKGIFCNGINYMFTHILLIIGILVSGLVYLTMGERIPLILMLVIWACSFYDFRKIIKVFLGCSLVLMVLTWGMSFVKFIPEIISVRNSKYRYALGFVYPLETTTFFLFLVICYIYLQNKKYNFKDFVAINLMNMMLYSITGARTSCILMFVATTLALIYAKAKTDKVFDKLFPWLGYVMVAFCTIGSLAGGWLYDLNNSTWAKMNDIISNRLHMMHRAFEEYDLTLFGEKIEWVGYGGLMDINGVVSSYNFVDCSYGKILLDYGIVFLVLILVGYGVAYYIASKKKEYGLLITITIVLIVSVMEPRLISLEMNPFVLLLGGFFLKENKSLLKIKHETNS